MKSINSVQSKWSPMMLILLLAFCALGCNKENIFKNLPILGPTQTFYALTDNAIVVYNARDVRNAGPKINISGLSANENLTGIDFRPTTGELYAVSNLSKIYTINITTGAAKVVSTAALTPALNGTIVNMDFNPVSDLIRIVTSSGQNLRVDPETATVVTVDINVSSTTVSGIAHTNAYAGATLSTLYDLDPVARKLFKQDPQDNGTLVSVGNLNMSLGENVSFDISPDNTKALAVGKLGDSTKLFTINLTNGEATIAGKFALGTAIKSIAIPTNPAAYAVDNNNNLLIFNPRLKTFAPITRALTGLQPGEKIYGIDMRPLNGQLYALGSSNRLYIINIGTGSCVQVGSGTFGTPLVGTSFGFDFNPLTDQIRVVSDARQNISINPITAAVTPNTAITQADAAISAAAYDNNFRTTTASTLYVIDHSTDKLYSLVSTTGILTEIGALKANVSEINGFDINSNNLAYGVFTIGGKTNLYEVDLGTGSLKIGAELSTPINGFAMALGL